jgi:hypothetical protein
MSFPAAVFASPAAAAINPLEIAMASLNSNPYLIGIMMLLLNLGGRFLALEVSKGQEKFLSQPAVRRFFLFVVLFVATRNILIAACLSVIVILCLGYLFNENSELCLWNSCVSIPEVAKTEGFAGLTAEEAMILKRLQDKQSAASKAVVEEVEPEKPTATASILYSSALTSIGS